MIPKLLQLSKPVRMVEISRDSYGGRNGTLWEMNMNIRIRRDKKNQRYDNDNTIISKKVWKKMSVNFPKKKKKEVFLLFDYRLNRHYKRFYR